MAYRDLLGECLKNLKLGYDTKCSRDAIETLLKIHRNILENEEETKYRKIRPENPAFSRKVWDMYPARQFMLESGWKQIHGFLIFNEDERLYEIIQVLLDHREIVPTADEWVDNNKFEGKGEEQLREEELRRKAAIERQKELDEYNKDKRYREELSESIKAQIVDDKNNRRQIFTHPVVGNKLTKGARVKSLSSPSTAPGKRNDSPSDNSSPSS